MEKHPHNCIRNCMRIDLCENCEFFKSVKVANAELEAARELFNLWMTNRKTVTPNEKTNK